MTSLEGWGSTIELHPPVRVKRGAKSNRMSAVGLNWAAEHPDSPAQCDLCEQAG